MTFKSPIWYPIALGLSVLNLVAAGFAGGQGEPLHASIHVAVGLAFGLWAQRLRLAPRGGDLEAGFEALEFEVSKMRQELSEAQERLDFAERLLAQPPEQRRVDPQR